MKVQWPSLCLGVGLGLLMSLWLQKDCKPCAATLVSASTRGREGSERDARLTRLERELAALQSRRGSLLSGTGSAAGGTGGAMPVSLGASSSSPASSPATRQLWYWTDLVLDSLRPFDRLNGGITRAGLRLAEQKCKVSTWCHRAQVIDGRLYITDLRAIFFDRHYAMARVMPLLLTLQRFKLPDLDAVFSGTDYPIMEIPRDAAHMHRMYGHGQPIPPLFSPTANSITHDLPWPDFSFFPPRSRCGKACVHPLKTPRWQEAHPNLLQIGKKVAWEDKIDRAVFTGNMKTSPNRQAIYHFGEVHPDLFFVNEVYIKTSPPSCFEIDEPNVTRGGVLSKRCGLSFPEVCRYKYTLNVGSNGYANKLKYLFLCGSVVIWVRKDSLNHEFFERQFMPGVHYVAADTVQDVPDAVRRLQADPEYARGIARAGYERMAQMDTLEVTHYCAEMLKGYAALQRFKPKRDPRSFEVNCEDDLIRHYERGRDGFNGLLTQRYLTEDNSTCLRPPAAGETLGPPGWGGAHRGEKAPCLASHDLAAKEEQGVCDPTSKRYAESGRLDGPDWDAAEAYKGGALPDWTDADPADTGRASRTHPYNSRPIGQA